MADHIISLDATSVHQYRQYGDGIDDNITVYVNDGYAGIGDNFATTDAADTITFIFDVNGTWPGLSGLDPNAPDPGFLQWNWQGGPFFEWIDLSNVSTNSGSGGWGGVWNGVTIGVVCFTRDTMIDTDAGDVAVQGLAPGMMVRTRDNGMQPIRWIGMSPTRDRAVRIKAGAMGNTRDLVVSPRHRMVLDGWQLEMLFDHDEALVTALELINDSTIVRDELADVEYYHVMFDQHEVIYAEGAATESFHPDQPSLGSMDAAAREEIFALFPDLKDGAKRAEAAPQLSVTQAAYIGKNLDAFIN